MITLDDYRNILSKDGRNLAQIRRNDAVKIVNQTFTGDIEYKRVYILDRDEGWHYTDAHFIKHSAVSIAKDQVDTYLQFRPYEHHKIGTYVFVPDDTSPDLTIDENDPLHGDVSNLWMIVGRNDANQFVRYMILKCNWNFKWVGTIGGVKKIMSCIACTRSANSYTSGVWSSQYTTQLDNLTSAWFPNTYFLYGDSGLKEYGIDDTRYLVMGTRMMITLNHINPVCYMVTKIIDMSPQGIIKFSLKEDEFHTHRDNAELLICDYYTDDGNIAPVLPDDDTSDTHTSTIIREVLNSDENLVEDTTFEPDSATIAIGETQYFKMATDADITAHWKIKVVNNDSELSDELCKQLEAMMVIRQVDDTTISLRAGKSYRLPEHKFVLSASDINGDYSSSITIEVTT